MELKLVKPMKHSWKLLQDSKTQRIAKCNYVNTWILWERRLKKCLQKGLLLVTNGGCAPHSPRTVDYTLLMAEIRHRWRISNFHPSRKWFKLKLSSMLSFLLFYVPWKSLPSFKNGASFWRIINSYLKKWWFVNQPLKNGGWTSRASFFPLQNFVCFSIFSHIGTKNLRKPTNSFQSIRTSSAEVLLAQRNFCRQTSRVLILVNLDSTRISGT